jgi:EAL domain-containing protein (putative c-di-GMP-specific phosphodiesterase class I)
VILENVRQLGDAGYSFSLDDYGTGYSSIHRMNTYPLDVVKIDKSMADDMFSESGNIIMFNTIRMMHDIKKKLVIEGVETEAAVKALKEMSCDYIQGYYYSRPLSEEDLIVFLRENRRTQNVS